MGRSREKSTQRDDEIVEEEEEYQSEESSPEVRPRRNTARKQPQSKRRHNSGITIGSPSGPRTANMPRGTSLPRRSTGGRSRSRRDYDSDDDISSPPHNAEHIGPLEISRAIRKGGSRDEIPPREINYSKNSSAIKKYRYMDPFEYEKSQFVADHRFHSVFHCDYYNTVILKKPKNPVLRQRWIDWEACASINDDELNDALHFLEYKNVKNIMTFRHDWNDEVICQFFTTLFIEAGENEIMHFMIEGTRYKCSYKRFAKILGFTEENDLEKDKCHLYREPHNDELGYMHVRSASKSDYCKTKAMIPYYRYLNLLVRQTIIPKGGNASNIQSTTKTLLTYFDEEVGGDFSVFDIIWNEILATSWTSTKSCSHAPYIMRMIEVVTKKVFVKDVTHESYVPLRIYPDEPSRRSRRAAPSTRSSPSPVPSPPPHPSSSRAAAASRSFTRRSGKGGLGTLIKKGLSGIFGMCKNIQKDVYEHREYTRKKLYEFEERQKKLYAKAGISPPTSPVQPLEPLPPPPEYPADPWTWYDEMMASGAGGSSAPDFGGDDEDDQNAPAEDDQGDDDDMDED